MQYNLTVRKKDGGFQIIVSYKDGYKWKQKSKQGFATQRDAKLYGQEIVDNLKKTITNPLDDSLKDITILSFTKCIQMKTKPMYILHSRLMTMHFRNSANYLI